MQLSCLQENLDKGLTIVGRAIAARSTLPVLANVLVATDEGRLKLSATNLEIGIVCWVGAKVEQEGAITLPGRLLSDLVGSLAPERVDLKLDEKVQTMNLRCGRNEANVKGIAAEEFPIVLPPPIQGGIELPLETFKRMIDQVAFSAATDESRPVLTGVLCSFSDDHLTMAAADGYRLSIRSKDKLDCTAIMRDVIIPARSLDEVQRLCGQVEGETVWIYLGTKQVTFVLADAYMVTQVLEGQFPNYNEIVPKSHTTEIALTVGDFLKAVRLTRLMAVDGADIITLDVTPGDSSQANPIGQMVVSGVSPELGDSTAVLGGRASGEPVRVAFRGKFLVDALSVIQAGGSPLAVLYLGGSSSPGVLHAEGEDGFKHVIMPMHISR